VAVALLAAVGYGVGVWRGWWVSPSVRDVPEVEPASVEPVVTGLSAPWDLAFLPDGTALVTERDTTRLLSLTPEGAVTEIQRIEQAQPRGEGGLLGVAVSPTYEDDGWVYVYYTAAEDNRVARLQLGDPPEPILTGIPNAGNHNGGRIAFGPDGMLYVGTGDAGDGSRAQDRDNLAGKILRITPEGDPAPGNPFGDGSPVYSWGHRNVQGLAWGGDGQLYASEFGQNRYDELNRIEPGGNYGWPEVEGDGGEPGFVDPIATWAPIDASCSGIAYQEGQVWLACLRGQRLYRIGADGSAPAELLTGGYGRLRHVAVAPDGALWVLTNNHDGRGSPGPDDDQILRLAM
jgi:glucose/arabinose dehydrogenase